MSEVLTRDVINFESPTAQILFSLVRMEVAGPKGGGVGTAFVYTQQWKGQQAAFLVASRHVVNGAQSGRLYFTRSEESRPILGQHVRLDLDEFGAIWHPHPSPRVDLAITPFGPLALQLQAAGKSVFNSALNETLIPSPDNLGAVDATQDLLIVGFAAELQDPAHVLPTVLRGVTATPSTICFAGEPHFLVQVPVFAGMSGSPVLSVRSTQQATPQGIVGGFHVTLLGVLSDVAVRQDHAPAAYVSIPLVPPGVLTTVNWAPFGLALRSWAIREIVEDLLRTIESTPSTATAPDQTRAPREIA